MLPSLVLYAYSLYAYSTALKRKSKGDIISRSPLMPLPIAGYVISNTTQQGHTKAGAKGNVLSFLTMSHMRLSAMPKIATRKK